MGSESNVIYLPTMPVGIYEPDHWASLAEWRRERRWEVDPGRPATDPEAVRERYQRRANSVARMLKEVPLLIPTTEIQIRGKVS